MFKHRTKSYATGQRSSWKPSSDPMVNDRLRDLIELHSHDLPLGRCCRCPRACYRGANVRSLYTGFGCLLLVAGVVLLGIWFGAVSWYYYSLEFVQTQCRVIDMNTTRNRDLDYRTCNCEATGRRHCTARYPCKKIWVEYVFDQKWIKTVIRENNHLLREHEQCSFRPEKCNPRNQVNIAAVDSYVNTRGQPGYAFTCFYHPRHTYDVIRTLDTNTGSTLAFHGLFWPSLGIAVFSLGIVIPLLICGCRLVWKKSVPEGFTDADHEQGTPLDDMDRTASIV